MYFAYTACMSTVACAGAAGEMAPLPGSWGMQRFGPANCAVPAALEERYDFVEERGPWEAKARRLEKELLALSRQQQRVRY